MTIAGTKQLRIVDCLTNLDYHPQSVTSKQYRYLSPLHNGRTPPFRVNGWLNEWCDSSVATDGDLMKLGKYLYQTNSVSEVLVYIRKHKNAIPIQRVRAPGTVPRPAEIDMKDVLVVSLQHYALLLYLHFRGVDRDIGRMFHREVHYELRQRRYFVLAFGNVAGGYRVRNPYYKGCIRYKDISVVGHSHSEVQNRVCVFGGFMDSLSCLTLKQMDDDAVCIDAPCDYLMMNSVNNLRRALERLQMYGEIHCYLDNDLAGQRTEGTIASIYGKRVCNETLRYHRCKDLDDYLHGKKR